MNFLTQLECILEVADNDVKSLKEAACIQRRIKAAERSLTALHQESKRIEKALAYDLALQVKKRCPGLNVQITEGVCRFSAGGKRVSVRPSVRKMQWLINNANIPINDLPQVVDAVIEAAPPMHNDGALLIEGKRCSLRDLVKLREELH